MSSSFENRCMIVLTRFIELRKEIELFLIIMKLIYTDTVFIV